MLTDIYGATPSNIALKLLEPGRVEGVAGVNLPMLLRALTYRDKDMETLVTTRHRRRPRRRAQHAEALNGRRCRASKPKSSTSWACMPAPRPS